MFQLDWVNTDGTRHTTRHTTEASAWHDYEILESGCCPDPEHGHPYQERISEPADWVALTEDRDTPKGYRLVIYRGSPNMPDRVRLTEGATP